MPPKVTPLKCLVVDDSALYRKVVRDVLAAIPDVEVVGIAVDGEQALQKIEELRPDLVTLDLEMPRIDGIGVLRELSARGIDVPAIMVSAFTARGAKSTTTALGLGAFDFILKPTTSSLDESILQLRRDLVPKVRACRMRLASRRQAPTRPAPTPRKMPPACKPGVPLKGCRLKPEIIAIGVSTGGPQALTRLLPKLPANFPAPIVLVQHMPPMFTKSLADDLDRHCALKVSEAVHGQPIRRGEILIAPGGKHMRVTKLASGPVVQITDDPPERNCKPAVDYLFRSVAEHYGAKSLGVILTGMGDDGTLGAKELKKAGATIITQGEASCVVYGMPKSIVDNHLADVVSPLSLIHEQLMTSVHRKAAI